MNKFFAACGDSKPLNIILSMADLLGERLLPSLFIFRVGSSCKKYICSLIKDEIEVFGESIESILEGIINRIETSIKIVRKERRKMLLVSIGDGCYAGRVVEKFPRNFISIHKDHGYMSIPGLMFLLNILDFTSYIGFGSIDFLDDVFGKYFSNLSTVVLFDSFDKYLFDKFLGGFGIETYTIIDYMKRLIDEEEVYLPDLHGIVLNIITPANDLLMQDFEKIKEILSLFPGVEYIESNLSIHSFYCYGEYGLDSFFVDRDTEVIVRMFDKIPHRIILSVDAYTTEYLYRIFKKHPYVIGFVPQFIYSSFMRGGKI